MVNQSIKVYARVKKGFEEKPSVPYDITTNKEDFEDLTFYLSSRCTLNNISGFRKVSFKFIKFSYYYLSGY
ncbi:unnamed protein product [Diabrotica balteata]|uniref:Uncharacterized protein n=1 Tax=Diabrotica balteata TaxID=107213 RepID=A0A9N9T3L6_DIABA|nr:unnamed protein product [Diabrotica balteata]